MYCIYIKRPHQYFSYISEVSFGMPLTISWQSVILVEETFDQASIVYIKGLRSKSLPFQPCQRRPDFRDHIMTVLTEYIKRYRQSIVATNQNACYKNVGKCKHKMDTRSCKKKQQHKTIFVDGFSAFSPLYAYFDMR